MGGELPPLNQRLTDLVKKWLKGLVLWVGGAVTVSVAAAAGIQALFSHLSRQGTPVPGELVELDGRQVHMLCAGDGSPTVILEAGLPGNSLAWMSVYSEIAGFTRVCAYDRPGYGWSEPIETPRTAETIVQELRMLLQRTETKPPYVLVGHSFGGLLMQLYATRFPDDYAGVVLVDSSHPDQAHRTLDLQEIDSIASSLKVLGPLGFARMLFPVPAGDPSSRDSSVRKREKELLMTNQTLRTVVEEMSGLRESLRQVGDSSVDFGNKPFVVLTEGRERAESWHAMQEDLSRLSTNSEWQVVEDAGHFIQHDRPEVVVKAVRTVIGKLETATDGPSP